MAKKRSCRRSADEDRIHEKAVKIRKMTDEQLVNYIEDRVEKARSEGFNCGKAQSEAPAVVKVDVAGLLEEIEKVRGIGVTKMKNIRTIVESRLGVAN